MSALPASGSMAAHDQLVVAYGAWLQSVAVEEIDEAWEDLSLHAANCGRPPGEPHLPDWAARRIIAYAQLMGVDGNSLGMEPFSLQSYCTGDQSWT